MGTHHAHVPLGGGGVASIMIMYYLGVLVSSQNEENGCILTRREDSSFIDRCTIWRNGYFKVYFSLVLSIKVALRSSKASCINVTGVSYSFMSKLVEHA